jgi:hypothetical protein
MADVATSVLHNVGNVLNSVNVSACVLRDVLTHSKSAGLAKATRMLGEQADVGDFIANDEKGRRLPGYLGSVAAAIASCSSSQR